MMTLQAAERGKAKSAQAMVMLSAEISSTAESILTLFALATWKWEVRRIETHILIENSRYKGFG